MPWFDDMDAHVQRILLAKKPAEIRTVDKKSEATEKSNKPENPKALTPKALTLKASVTLNDLSGITPDARQFALQLSQRPDPRRAKYDPKLFEAMEAATIAGDLTEVHKLLIDIYETHKDPDSGWAMENTKDYFAVVADDLRPLGVDLGVAWGGYDIQLNIQATEDDGTRLGIWVSTTETNWASDVYTRVQTEEAARSRFAEISKIAMQKKASLTTVGGAGTAK